MPDRRFVSITLGISKVRFSRIRLRTAGVQSMTSTAGTMPGRSMRLNSVCETTACSVLASMDRIWFCWPGGYMSMIRSTVCDAFDGVQRGEHEVAGLGGGDRQRPSSRGRASRRRG